MRKNKGIIRLTTCYRGKMIVCFMKVGEKRGRITRKEEEKEGEGKGRECNIPKEKNEKEKNRRGRGKG